ncbi:MAG: hypothetical protein IFK92_03805 [Acidobacteria bacterium]|nr:hypothetical protein [Candidatus Sulfomarinibacter kjeldsenii]
MGQKISHPVAPVLEEAQRRFASWRSTGRKGRRIPEELWQAATLAAGELGVNPVSRAIGLDYMRLKRRVTGSDGVSPQTKSSPTTAEPTFVELAMDTVTRIAECVVEFEGARGKFTLRLAGHNPADVAALAEALSRPER